MSRGKYCMGVEDFALASRVAQEAGLEAPSLGSMETCTWTSDGEEDGCEGCGKIIPKGNAVYFQSGSYEYPDDGSYYGSPACATGMHMAYPGSFQFFLECMGWMLEPETPDRAEWKWIWTLREKNAEDRGIYWERPIISRGSVGKKDGPSPTFRKHLALARKLAKEFRRMRRAGRASVRQPGEGYGTCTCGTEGCCHCNPW